MGEVASGVLTFQGTPYIVTVGEHPAGDANEGATLLFNLDTQEASLGDPRPAVGHHHAGEVVDNKLYVLGGLEDGQGDVQIASLEAGSDGGVDVAWELGPPVPFQSGSAATALIDGKIYYCGGVDGDNTGTVDTCAALDTATGTWTDDVAPMLLGRNHAATCTDGTKMYVFGGREGRNVVGPAFTDTQIYDPATNSWSIGADMPVALGGMGKAVYADGACFVFGGEVSSEVAPDEAIKISEDRTSYGVYRYDIAGDAWSSEQDMPLGLHGIFPVLVNNMVHINGGGVQAANSQSTTNLVYVLPADIDVAGPPMAAEVPMGAEQ